MFTVGYESSNNKEKIHLWSAWIMIAVGYECSNNKQNAFIWLWAGT